MNSLDAQKLIEKFKSKEAVVGVIGLGYVGLPLVMEFCRNDFRVVGFDIDTDKIERLNRGESYIHHIPSEEVSVIAKGGLLEATSDFSRASEADAILICVPTPLADNHEPDLSYIEATAKAIAPHVREGQLIILESTTYPGTTKEVLRVILETGGLKAGVDFLLAYSPEREDPGNPTFSTSKIPKVVGGTDAASLDAADALYSQIVVSTVRVSNTETAEAVKLLENIFRSVNIALVNELKMVYSKMGIDVWEVIEAAKSKPFGFMPFYPGPGLGGHCIPIDPFYLTWKAKQHGVTSRFIELAGEVNTAMPDYVIAGLEEALETQGKSLSGARVVVLGIAYKKDVADPRESPGITLLANLLAKGADVSYSDPLIPSFPVQRRYDLELDSVALTPESLSAVDAVLIAADHSDFDYELIVKHAPLIVDTRNATHGIADPQGKIHKA
ncbi:MAG: nucleotide sugar dehydrogenase [Candidatus Hydrogenedentota bacterium]